MRTPDRKSPKKPDSRRAEPARSDLTEAEEQQQLTERFKAERIKLDQDLVDARRGLELQHAALVTDLERRELIAWAELRRQHGRQLGAGMLRTLGELDGWKGDTDGPA